MSPNKHSEDKDAVIGTGSYTHTCYFTIYDSNITQEKLHIKKSGIQTIIKYTRLKYQPFVPLIVTQGTIPIMGGCVRDGHHQLA